MVGEGRPSTSLPAVGKAFGQALLLSSTRRVPQDADARDKPEHDERRAAGRLSALLRARMGLLVDRQQTRGIDLRIALGGGERGVAEQLLDGAQIPAAGEKMGCEAVAQRMGRGGGGKAEQQAKMLQPALHDARIE